MSDITERQPDTGDGLRKWALWSFAGIGFDDLEENTPPPLLDWCIKAWDFYTSKGLDFGSAACRVIEELSLEMEKQSK